MLGRAPASLARSLTFATPLALSLLVATSAKAQQPAPACTSPKTTCDGADGYYASHEDRERLAALVDPILKDLRSCLDAAGGKHVTPTVFVRFDPDGKVVAQRVEVTGYESLPCVAQASGRLTTLQISRETSLRCEYGCGKPQAQPQPLPPPVVPPPTTATPPSQPPPPPARVPPEPVKPPPQTEKVWYGWQTLLVDGAWGTMLAIGVNTKSTGLNTAAIITGVLGPPVVHFAHAKVGMGFASLGMRILLPPIGAGVGAIAGLIAGSGSRSASEVGDAAGTGAIVGLVAGALICVIIDATAFGWDKETVSEAARLDRRPTTGWLTVAPTVDVQKDRASIGVGGRF